MDEVDAARAIPPLPQLLREEAVPMLELTDPEIRAYIVRLLWQHLSMYPDVVREIAEEIHATGRYDDNGRPKHMAPTTQNRDLDFRFEMIAGPGDTPITLHDLEVAYRRLREGCVVLEVAVTHFLTQSNAHHKAVDEPRRSSLQIATDAPLIVLG